MGKKVTLKIIRKWTKTGDGLSIVFTIGKIFKFRHGQQMLCRLRLITILVVDISTIGSSEEHMAKEKEQWHNLIIAWLLK